MGHVLGFVLFGLVEHQGWLIPVILHRHDALDALLFPNRFADVLELGAVFHIVLFDEHLQILNFHDLYLLVQAN